MDKYSIVMLFCVDNNSNVKPPVMKKIIITLVLSAIACAGFAQEKIVPRTEFTIDVSVSSIEAVPGQNKNVEVHLNRSKSYSKLNATLGILSGLPEGVTVNFEPAEGVINSSVATITITEDTRPGIYTLIFRGTIQQKSKGATLKLVVKELSAEAVSLKE